MRRLQRRHIVFGSRRDSPDAIESVPFWGLKSGFLDFFVQIVPVWDKARKLIIETTSLSVVPFCPTVLRFFSGRLLEVVKDQFRRCNTLQMMQRLLYYFQ
jgi:hypothetical protein